MDRMDARPERADFEQWYGREHGRVLASLTLISGDADLAREATDEAFARAVLHWARVGAMASPGGWTFRVALNQLRRSSRRRAVERTLLRRCLPADTMSAPAGEAWAIVADLPVRQRTAIVLRYVADLTEAEIGEAMGVQRGTVSSPLADARRSLAEQLREPDPTAEVCHVAIR